MFKHQTRQMNKKTIFPSNRICTDLSCNNMMKTNWEAVVSGRKKVRSTSNYRLCKYAVHNLESMHFYRSRIKLFTSEHKNIKTIDDNACLFTYKCNAFTIIIHNSTTPSPSPTALSSPPPRSPVLQPSPSSLTRTPNRRSGRSTQHQHMSPTSPLPSKG